jgi:TonB family protein
LTDTLPSLILRAKWRAPLAFCGIRPSKFAYEKSVVVPPFKSFGSGKDLNSSDSDSSPSNPLGTSAEIAVLSSLKELVANGDQRLDPILAKIAEAAQQLTAATAAAIAMWKEGTMVCRARSGPAAPALGMRLIAETGISGECLRTGKVQVCADTEIDPHVDLEVCRSLGLRSIAVLPVQGWRGVNGILEVFSTKPSAFTEQHIGLLYQLAALAERARASQPHGSSSLAPKSNLEIAIPQPAGLLPASDRVGDVAFAVVGSRSRTLVSGVLGLAGIALVASVIWLGWRGADDGDRKAHAASPIATARALPGSELPDNDPVWRPDPGGETLFSSKGNPAAGSPVTFASKVDAIPGKNDPNKNDQSNNDNNKEKTDRPLLLADLGNKVATATMSHPLSGGQLIHRTTPAYPAEARQLHLEGVVVLSAVVTEDGSLRAIKVVNGPAPLAQSAVDAVALWRYAPFILDGKPVERETTISVDFSLPSNTASR